MTNPTTPQQSDREAADETCQALLQLVEPDRLPFFRDALTTKFAHHAQQARLEERERAAKLLDDLAEIARAGAIGGHCDPLEVQLLDGAYSGAADMIRKGAIRKGEAE